MLSIGRSENGEGVAHLELAFGMSAEKFVDGASGARKLGIVVVVDDDDPPASEARIGEAEASLDRAVEVAVTEGESDFVG